MNIDLSSFYDKDISTVSFEGELDENYLEIGGRKINFVEPIKYKGEVYKVDSDKLLQGSVSFKYEEACGRCLESFVKEATIALSGKLIEKADEDSCDDEDDYEVIYYVGGKVDLTEYIMTMVILSLPMKPLCNEECKGLCSRCGTNHNKEECHCVIENVDPRLEKLKELFPKE